MLNKVILIGKIFKEPELKYFKDSKTITVLRIVTNDIINGIEQNNWHRIIINKKIKEKFKKNMMIAVVGKIKTRKWLDKNKYNYITEIFAEEIKILEKENYKDFEIIKNNDNKDYDKYKEKNWDQEEESIEKEMEKYNSDNDEIEKETEYNEYYDENFEEENNN